MTTNLLVRNFNLEPAHIWWVEAYNNVQDKSLHDLGDALLLFHRR